MHPRGQIQTPFHCSSQQRSDPGHCSGGPGCHCAAAARQPVATAGIGLCLPCFCSTAFLWWPIAFASWHAHARGGTGAAAVRSRTEDVTGIWLQRKTGRILSYFILTLHGWISVLRPADARRALGQLFFKKNAEDEIS